MINWQRMFEVYRKLADSTDAYLRTVVFKQKIKGFNRLERAIQESERKTKQNDIFVVKRLDND